MSNWKGGRTKTTHGYIWVYAPNHPKAIHGRYIYEHVAIAEKALGRILPDLAEIHHVNGIPSDNSPSNLVICEDRKFHKLLHKRARALRACGNANWLCCAYCGQFAKPEDLYITPNAMQHWHRQCQKNYRLKKSMNSSVIVPASVVPGASQDSLTTDLAAGAGPGRSSR